MDEKLIYDFIDFVKNLYKKEKVGLHEPVFFGKEKEYLIDCIDSSYVSYIGQYVTRFEEAISNYTGSKFCIAVVNGTAGLHITLKAIGVDYDDEVITQPLTFVATANAIKHCGAHPVFVDVDIDTLGMSPESLENFLKKQTKYDHRLKRVVNKYTNRVIKAVLPVHVFGHPCRIDEIVRIADYYGLPVVEDATEALGSFYKGRHCGTFGVAGVFSFNGNKIITTGGGGAIITDNQQLALKLKHITTTAKIPHKWEYVHDEIGYNYRLPNINAALGVAQMEKFDIILNNKRQTAKIYKKFFDEHGIDFFVEPKGAVSNYWLNSVILKNREERDRFLEITNENGVNTRPVWRLMTSLKMYQNCYSVSIENSKYIEDRLVNIPSGVRQC